MSASNVKNSVGIFNNLKRWRRKSFNYAFIAILVIFTFSSWFIHYNTFIQHQKLNKQQPKNSKSRSRIVLGILADGKLMNTTVIASQKTWIPSFPYDIFYFVGKYNQNSFPHLPKLNIVELPTDDNVYPPINKTFLMWTYFYLQYLSHYNYFMAIDADTYVNVENLQRMLSKIKCKNCYIGFPAKGEPYERKELGLQAPYCLGMGYVIARETLRRFAPHIDICRRSIVANHSDTELGRCIYRFASGISCIQADAPLERVMYTTNNEGTLVPLEHDENGKIKIEFPIAPPTRFFKAALVHPLKRSHAFYQFHRQVKLQLRPILPPAFLNGSCVVNPIIQNETYPQNRSVHECRLRLPKQSVSQLSSLTAFVITLRGHEKRLKRTIQNFKKHNIHLQPFYGVSNVSTPKKANLTQGEWNFRLTMTRLIQKVIKSKLHRVLIVEDDAIPHRNFSQLFKKLINDHRCRECVYGGVLMLGSTTWPLGWRIFDRYKNTEKGMCRNICTENYGSFAVLLCQTVFQPILAWLQQKTIPKPYDYIFAHLSRIGHPVRLASPNLVISDIRHVSLIRPRPNNTVFHNITLRAKIHRWKLENYMISPFDTVF